ncbi:hypothetical protein ACFY2R_29210 [Micromonospora olivasterospora]|uniref:hypothetical protein n=1 Tax=Micromonospora olivasterospora TaxID=1880 RepID=UPI0031DB8041
MELSEIATVPFVAAARGHDRRAAVRAFRQVAATVAGRLHGMSARAGGGPHRLAGVGAGRAGG